MIIALLGIKNIYERKSYNLENCNFVLKETLVFSNEVDCKSQLSKLLQKDFVKASNFDIYKYCIGSRTFKNLLLETTSNVCVFIGVMFPVCISSPDELFELFHAVNF